MPNFENFETAVEIIDVDDDKPSRIHWGATKRELDTEADCGISNKHSNEWKKGKGCEIVYYDELCLFRPDGYVMGQDAADAAAKE